MEFLSVYGLFLAKFITVILGIFIILLGIAVIAAKGKARAREYLEVKKINDKYHALRTVLVTETTNKDAQKEFFKAEKAEEKSRENEKKPRKRIFVLNFHGDIKATEVKLLREEITSILLIAKPTDEVFVNLESAGGMVHSYGLAASQLQRLRQHGIPLTVSIDKVAASGGYLMACVASHIIAAPFAIIGSIGVIAQIPNVHRLLKKNDIDFEQITAGEYKRTLTIFGENTEKGRVKLKEEVEQIHDLFKQFITENRPSVNVDEVATGEHWSASVAMNYKLVDALMTSDDYLLNASKEADLYQVTYVCKKKMSEKFSFMAQSSLEQILQWWEERSQSVTIR